MKKTSLALTAVLAFSGAALAGTTHQPNKQAPVATCIDAKTGVKLDCGATGSLEKATDGGSAAGQRPKLGIDVNPWFVPGAL